MDDLKQKILNAAHRLFADTPIEFAYLYGSVAKELKNPFSDLDVAVFVEGLDRKRWVETKNRGLKIGWILACWHY